MHDLATGPDRFELTVPGRARSLVPFRLFVAAVAADAGCTVDEIDDLRLAVSEAFALLVDVATPPTAVALVIEVDGRDPRRKRPYPDAYRKEYLEPDPAEVVYDRALYQVWHAALQVLVADLRGELQSIALVGPAAPAEPWVTGVQQARILPSIRPMTADSAGAVHRRGRRVRASA